MNRIKRPLVVGIIAGLVGVALVGGLFILMNKPAWERPIDVALLIEERAWQIGDRIPVTLRITAEHGYEFTVPELKPAEKDPMPEDLEFAKEAENRKESFRSRRYEGRYTFMTFTPGEYQFPALTITYTTPAGEHKNIQLPAAALTVHSLLTDDAKEIRGLKPLAKAPVNPLLYHGFALVALLGLIVYLLIRRSRRPAQETTEAEPPLPAHALAYRRLNELLVSDWIETGQIERYFTVLSGIVREYIEQRFGTPAREMTTQEFLGQALRKLGLAHDQQETLRRFMELSDLVKYAQHVPSYEKIREAYDTAKRFVDETREADAVTGEEGGGSHAESRL